MGAVFPREEHGNALPNTKWSGLKAHKSAYHNKDNKEAKDLKESREWYMGGPGYRKGNTKIM